MSLVQSTPSAAGKVVTGVVKGVVKDRGASGGNLDLPVMNPCPISLLVLLPDSFSEAGAAGPRRRQPTHL